MTNAHVVKNLGVGTAKVIVDPGMDASRTFEAKLVRADSDADLALLRVEKAKGLTALELGTIDDLVETVPVVAFGYPFGTSLTLEKGQYPAVSVNAGRVTSLRLKQGELELIQIDAALNPGNSGGPVLDEKGRVVGIVQSGVARTGVNFAIPVSRLQKRVLRPEIQVTIPTVPAAKRHDAQAISVRIVEVTPKTPAYAVELTLTSGPNDMRTVSADAPAGVARFQVPIVPAVKGPRELLATASYAGGSIAGRTVDREIALGDRKIGFSEISLLKPGKQAVATLTDGREVTGPLAQTDQIVVDLGGVTAAIDLTKAASITFEDPDKSVPAVKYKVVVKEGNRIVGEAAGNIELAGRKHLPLPNRPWQPQTRAPAPWRPPV